MNLFWQRYKFSILVIFLMAVNGFSAFSQKETDMGKKTFLALGDSYTIGEGVSVDARWPVQLADSLNREGFNFDQPQIIAKTGWTTDELEKAIAEAGPEGPFDLVSLLIGVNNQYRGRALEEYEVQFEGLLKQALRFAGNDPGKVIVVSIPDYGVTPFAASRDPAKIAKEIDAFNKAARLITQAYKISFIDITPGSRMASRHTDLIADDQLHPSARMYTQWVAQILPVVLDKLGRQ